MEVTQMLVQLVGGLGLFLYGMKVMGDGLENAAGDRLKGILEKVTSNKFVAVAVGTVVTMIIQSSSATTVMVVGFVNAGLMNLFQATGVIMGANIGTTITAQMVSLNLTSVAPIFIGIGTALVIFSKGKKNREIGNIVLGFGVLFLGMDIMGAAMEPFRQNEGFKNIMLLMSENWIIALGTGLLMTAIIQSSSATTGILIVLASQGEITLSVAIPFIFGCNIGTCVTALLSSVGASKSARKAALIHVIFNIIGTVIFIPLRDYLVDIAQLIRPGNSPRDIQRQIANIHTIFNVANTFILIWFTKYLVAFVNKLIPGEDEKEVMGTKYIDDRVLQTPVIAVGQMVKETIRMANKAKENLEIAMRAFESNDENLIKKVYENEKLINLLENEITDYLIKLSNTNLSEEQLAIVTSTFHVVNDIERIGDHAENIADLTTEKIVRKLDFSEEAIENLGHMYKYTINSLEGSIDSYEHHDVEKAKSITSIEERIDTLEREYREAHIKRLNAGQCGAYCGAVFLDIISNLERIGDHAINIAETVVNN
ncbi:Phosphate uptake regulator [Clostridium sp. N3C]|uniref:Na/Pi cotransporter family protein n=1 Tax=Clostridium sp. N3C TaxID=1776758 RepID=UPI00092E108C|nr:Na/Pi cotransporter family protein [Clostridium sp. N3C]SCN24140.1 Phosphate uptake regulator [Clostridium sp. N3C]